MKSDALILAEGILEYFSDKADGHFVYRWEQDRLTHYAFKVKQQEEMREWNL